MLRTYIVAFFLLLITPITNAQKCEDILRWYESVAKEFPDINYNNVRSGEPTYNIIRFNLLTDKYFIPFYGKAYLSLTEKVKIYKLIQKCKYKNDQVSALNWYMWGVFDQPQTVKETTDRIELILYYEQNIDKSLNDLKKNNLSISSPKLASSKLTLAS